MECVEVVEALSQKEKNKILSVLQRDEKLRDEQDLKIRKLKGEIGILRSHAVLKAGDDQNKICLRCRKEFGFLFNRGVLCPVCKHRVCKECQEILFNGSWLCSLCYRQRQLKWLTGEWASFEQNPLRKWASGSDILRASMSLSIGTATIDLDQESEDRPKVSNNNQRSRKPAHNGVTSPRQETKSRVEYPKENDQLKLSQLFDVLRSKKPADEGPQETQVMKVSTRRYSESDSDSSSSSEMVLDNGSRRSSPNAPSVTESEYDARLHSPVSIDVSPPHSLLESPRSTDSSQLSPQEGGERGTRPVPAPRSPRPGARAKTKEPQAVVRPKTRKLPEKDKLKIGDESKVTMSRSVDINLGADLAEEAEYKRKAVSNNELNLQMHVNKTKESLDIKSRSQQTLPTSGPPIDQKRSSDSDLIKEQREYSKQRGEQAFEGKLQRPVSSDIEAASKVKVEKIKRKQKRTDSKQEDIAELKRVTTVESKPEMNLDIRERESEEIKHEPVEVHIDAMPEADRATMEIRRQSDTVNVQDNLSDFSDKVSVSSKTSKTSSEQMQMAGEHTKGEDDYQFVIPVPRSGSPYSFSMDSLPSSHPSPTMRHPGHDLSLIESSDNDSLSRYSQPEASEHSGTESVVSKNSEEEFDVEALSKVRFQRVSKKVGQMGILSQIKSPKRNVTADDWLPAETQSSRGVFEVCGEGGETPASFETPNAYTGDMTMTELEDGVDEFFLVSKATDNDSDNSDAFEEEPFVKESRSSQLNAVDASMQRLLQMERGRKESARSSRSVDMSWIDEYIEKPNGSKYTQEEIDLAREEWLHQQTEKGMLKIDSERRVKPSEADSIELMLDELTKAESTEQGNNIQLRPRVESEIVTDVNLTPDTPMSAYSPFEFDMPSDKRVQRYRFSYMSEDSADDLLDDDTADEKANSVKTYIKKQYTVAEDSGKKDTMEENNNDDESEKVVALKPALKAMGSLDLLLDQQGELVEDVTEDVTLDSEFQEVLKIAAAETSSAIDKMINKADDTTLSKEPDSKADKSKETQLDKTDDHPPTREFSFRTLLDRFSPKAEADQKGEKSFDLPPKINLTDVIELNQEKEVKLKLEDKEEIRKSSQNSAQMDFQKNTNNALGSVKLEMKNTELNFGLKDDKQDAMVKVSREHQLQSANSLDKLIECQGDNITEDEFDTTVDLTPELVLAMEQQFRADVKLDDSTLNSDIEWLPGECKDLDKTEKVSLYKFNVDQSEDFGQLFGTDQEHSKDKTLLDVDFTPIGFTQRPIQYDSNDSDALSVITEEDELSESSDEDNKVVDKKSNDDAGNEILTLNVTAPNEERYSESIDIPSQRGKLYVKVQDTRKQTTLTSKGGAARLIGNKVSNARNFKKVHDHWVAVEKHEADILDLEEDSVDNNSDDDENQVNDECSKSETEDAPCGKSSTGKHCSSSSELEDHVVIASADDRVLEESDVKNKQDHTQNQPISIVITDVDVDLADTSSTPVSIQQDEDTVKCASVARKCNEEYTSEEYIDNLTDKLPDTADEDNKKEVKESVQHTTNSSDKVEQSNEHICVPDLQMTNLNISINDKHPLCQSIADIGSFNIDPSKMSETMKGDEMFGVHKSVMECKSIGELQLPAEEQDSILHLPQDICHTIREGEADIIYNVGDDEEHCISIDEDTADLGNRNTVLSDEDIQRMLDSQITVVDGQIVVEEDKVKDKLGCEKMLGTHPALRFCNSIGDIETHSDSQISADDGVIMRRKAQDTLSTEEMLATRLSLRQCNSICDLEMPQDPALLSASISETCNSLVEGENQVFYNVQDEDEQCNSIDEIADFTEVKTKFASDIKVQKLLDSGEVKTTPDQDKTSTTPSKGKDKGNKKSKSSNTTETRATQHRPLKRLLDNKTADDLALEIMSLGPLAKNKLDSTDSDDTSPISPQASNMTDSPIASETSAVIPDVSPATGSSPNCSAPIPVLARNPPEKLAGVQETPQLVSEGSTVSQDDSGHVSGGTTPEHKRQDSNFSTSSIPSTLSTVTDRSTEEEDIDKVITNLNLQKAGSRGNLLSVMADSRESICSFYSDAGDVSYNTVPITGEVLFGVNYNYKTSMLEVAVKACKDIAVADVKKNKSDPYVKTYLLPDKTRSGKRKTKVKKHSTNPTFEETLRYSISKSELENRTLWLTIWHNDRFGRNIFLGEVTINFDYYKFDDPSPRWYPLQERIESQPASMMAYKGDLSVSIKFVTADKVNSAANKGKPKKDTGKGQLHVKVKEARNLTAVRSNGFSDPFCKGYLLPERHKSSKQKTTVLKKDCNPAWNHTFIFEDVLLLELRERCLELTIWDYEKLSSNDFLGGVRLNLGTGLSQSKPVDWMDARGEEMSIWQAMLDRPNIWIDGALILRPNMEKRKF